MSVDELEETIAKKPRPAPRTRKLEPDKPIEEMSIDEMMKAAEEPGEESAKEIVESSEDERVRTGRLSAGFHYRQRSLGKVSTDRTDHMETCDESVRRSSDRMP